MTEIRIVDPVTGAAKGSKPERYDLMPFAALDELARVFGFGAKKYADWNWLKGYRWSLGLAALLRHVSRWAQLQDLDSESGLNHLAHAAWHALVLLTFQLQVRGTDDRCGKSDVTPKGLITAETSVAAAMSVVCAKKTPTTPRVKGKTPKPGGRLGLGIVQAQQKAAKPKIENAPRSGAKKRPNTSRHKGGAVPSVGAKT